MGEVPERIEGADGLVQKLERQLGLKLCDAEVRRVYDTTIFAWEQIVTSLVGNEVARQANVTESLKRDSMSC